VPLARKQRVEVTLLDDASPNEYENSSASRTANRWWAMMNVVRPGIIVFGALPTRTSAAASNTLEASSGIEIDGFFDNARAMARRRRGPPGSVVPHSPIKCRSHCARG
jgi:hypothetical protein